VQAGFSLKTSQTNHKILENIRSAEFHGLTIMRR